MNYDSQTKFGKTEDFQLQVARGNVPGHRHITVFGYNPDVDTVEETIWPQGGIIPHPTVAINMTVSSTSANDTANGTGAQSIVIEGLLEDYTEVQELVTMNGQTPVTTVNKFLRINYVFVFTAGSGKSAAGDIYIGTGTVTAGVPATVYEIIKFDYNNSVTGHYTIPAGYTAYIYIAQVGAGQPGGTALITSRLLTTGTKGIRRTAGLTVSNNGNSAFLLNYPADIPEKTDIEATALGSSTNNVVTCFFNLVLVKNTQ